ncbi:hypothetical protein ABI59_10335 [Acidobacteria bacterium Mor1]|nr:hypothetical protein ABI59_10335 [Acidobacteria bacterium Mor1]
MSKKRLLVLVCLIASLLPACSSTDRDPPRQVIMILLDAARSDRFSAYGYEHPTTPVMDELAAAGVVFEQHYAQDTATRMSVPSYLYSRYFVAPIFPNSAHVPFSHPDNLFQRPDDEAISFVRAFEEAGFLTAAISAHNWTGEDTPFAEEFIETHSTSARIGAGKQGYTLAEKVIDYTIDWIDENREHDFFLYVHLMDTHFPHYFDGEAQTLFGASTYNASSFKNNGWPKDLRSPLSAEDRRYLDAMYDGSLRYADGQIGRLVEHLRKRGLERTAIAITSDHGENLLEGPGRYEEDGASILTHGGPWYEPVARIPFILYDPSRLQPARYAGPTEGVDVGPTLLALGGVPVPLGKRFDGVDLLEVLDGQAEPKPHALYNHGIRSGRYKCLFDEPEALLGEQPIDPEKLTGRLFDLEEDPGERVNLFEDRRDLVEQLASEYREALKAPYDRFVAARSGEQPRSAFAISAKHLSSESSWRPVRVGINDCLSNEPGDEPLEIEIPMPDGPYDLTLKLRGEAVVEVADQRQAVQGDFREMPRFGAIAVEGETFRATVTPQGEAATTLCFLGFTPPVSEVDAAAQEARLQRLRTLGYVQ